MKNITIFISNNGNYYLYNSFQKRLHCVEKNIWQIIQLIDKNGVDLLNDYYQFLPLLIDHKINITFSQFDKYKTKILYYIDGYDGDLYAIKPITKITPENIKYGLSNKPNIVFELTERCNLHCKYCGYGDFYNRYDTRQGNDLELHNAKQIIKYIFDLTNSSYSISDKQTIAISFYGGEPLLCFDLIKKIVLFTKELETESRSFTFNMTTNAILLDKYVDFLQEHSFSLLISLDGNRNNNSYRVFKNGQESFPIVISNIKYVMKRYADYFKKNISFNAVLHDRNSCKEINDFVLSNFNKKPMINEVLYDGFVEEKKEELLKMFKNKYEHIHSSEDYFQQLHDTDFSIIPDYHDTLFFIHFMCNLSYFDYKSLFLNLPRPIKLTGTCIPLDKSIFITANGKILPCEKTNHKYCMGYIDREDVHIDFEKIADQYNAYLRQLNILCSTCYLIASCNQCLYFLDFDKKEPVCCYGHLNKKKFASYMQDIVSYMEKYPLTFNNIIVDSVLEV